MTRHKFVTMSCCVKKHLNFLCLLSKAHPRQQRALLETAEPDQIRAICEVVYNVLHGNIHIPDVIKEDLKPHKDKLRGIADKKVSYNSKKKILVQTGSGVWASLIPIAISAISGLIKK